MKSAQKHMIVKFKNTEGKSQTFKATTENFQLLTKEQ